MILRHCGESLQDISGVLPGSCVATIGNFDGVHLGHVALVKSAVDRAASLGLPALGITFFPHPAQVLGKGAPLFLTQSFSRYTLLLELGLDALLVLPFSKELARTPAQDFCRTILAESLAVRELFVGYDFRLGHDRATAETVAEMGREYGFGLSQVEAVLYDEQPISSSRIRKALEEGWVERAGAMLGRPYSVRGEVVHGAGRGGPELGYPTANMDICGQVMPLPAVYATLARVVKENPLCIPRADGVCLFTGKQKTSVGSVACPDREKEDALPGMTSFGRNPTFGGQRLTLETHLLDFYGDLYGLTLEVAFCQSMRLEQKFSGSGELIAQLHKDKAARQMLDGCC